VTKVTGDFGGFNVDSWTRVDSMDDVDSMDNGDTWIGDQSQSLIVQFVEQCGSLQGGNHIDGHCRYMPIFLKW